ncbi:penicillin-binding transpeptidase domain-containing protein [Streptomyces sp. NPDC048197]|uniref:penicillin-binding transpeptidase domain-containing protein n=1 Tax=Streptomyces sp. NPDC048197 TaxID=3365511 RepID=UPI0037234967
MSEAVILWWSKAQATHVAPATSAVSVNSGTAIRRVPLRFRAGGGVATTDPSIPSDGQGGEQAAQFMGRGKVTATPLFMASVAATVRNVGCKQPIILPGQHQDSAPRSISARTAGYLQSMMRTVATSGTATPRLSGLAGVGAKTGTGEGGSRQRLAGRVQPSHSRRCPGGGRRSGVDSAGYVVRQLLTGS